MSGRVAMPFQLSRRHLLIGSAAGAASFSLGFGRGLHLDLRVEHGALHEASRALPLQLVARMIICATLLAVNIFTHGFSPRELRLGIGGREVTCSTSY